MVEQRGCGKSAPEKSDSTTISVTLTIEDFEIIRKEIGIKKWTVLGFSYGGLLATVYTNTYPKSVSSLFLLNSVGINPKPVTYFFDNINSKLRPSYVEVVEY